VKSLTCTLCCVVQGTVLLVLQKDRPGLIAAVGQELAEANVNISFMTVSRTQPGKDAVMAIGVDGQPPQSVLDKIPSISGIKEFALFDGPHQ
jgi:D-3-phosphoglycerate dehydrogenase